MNLEFQKKFEDEATDLRVISKWMLGKAIGLEEDICGGWINREEKGAISEHGAHLHLEAEERRRLKERPEW